MLRRMLPSIARLLLGLSACSPATEGLICGPGTHASEGTCLPDDPDTDATDTGTGGDTDAGTDSGTDPDGGTDSGTDSGTDTDVEPDRTVDVYLLAGQSNADGYGQTVSLRPGLQVAQDDVWIWWSGRPLWTGLQPSSYASGTSRRYFGPEVPLGRALADAAPERRTFVIKHAVPGTALHDYWYPGQSTDDGTAGEGYATFRATVQQAVAALEAEGHEPRIRGMAWMQGESDAIDPGTAGDYAANLTHLITRVREDTGVADLPFVAAQIDCRDLCEHRDVVNAAMASVADEDPAVHTFVTDDVGRHPDDGWHYQGTGVRAIGERFAARLLGEALPALPEPGVRVTGSFAWSYTGDYTVGWRFSLSEDVVLTDLGQFDLHLDGLAHATTVAVWDADTGALWVEGTVPAAETQQAPLVGLFRYAAITPTLLPAGDYIIGLQSFLAAPDYYVYEAQITEAAPVTWREARHEWSTVLSFPTQVVVGSTASSAWFGPNFLWVPAG